MDPLGVYANRDLRLHQILVYGFDYDYTLAHYSEELQTLIYDYAKAYLVEVLRYPESCLSFQYDASFPIRGLYYDKKRGYLLKLDFFHSVESSACYFGRRQVSLREIDSEYGGPHISVDDRPHITPLLDLFALSEACLISDVVQHFVDKGLQFDPSYVYDDVRESVNHVHKSGRMHREVMADPSRYLQKSAAKVQLLQRLKQPGCDKKLMLLTNSPFPFVDSGMKYLFEGSGVSWREFFDVIIASADKPNFYHSSRPFRQYDVVKDSLSFSHVSRLDAGQVYYHGSLAHFTALTGWKGQEVLYFGDQVYADLRGPSRAGWRTAAVIHELEREITIQNSNEYREAQATFNTLQEHLRNYHRLEVLSKDGSGAALRLAQLRRARAEARSRMRALFNTYFGATMQTASGRDSAFGYNVQRYADVYMSRVENLLKLRLGEAWLSPPHDIKIMPHHVKVPPLSNGYEELL